jgi:hypothetical protein
MLQSIKQNQAAMADSLGGCQSRTSIFPVTAAEIGLCGVLAIVRFALMPYLMISNKLIFL